MRCAEMAGIHDEIMRMPMAYNSLIGDMGSRCPADRSSGCFWREPSTGTRRFCSWTRATAHLDWDNERQISGS